MSVWLTPDLHPFFAGTYFPKGQFRQVLTKLADFWEEDKERLIQSGKEIIEQMKSGSEMAPSHSHLAIPALAVQVYKRLERSFDDVNGGFGSSPKFPSPSQTIHLLSRLAALYSKDEKLKHEAQTALEMAVRTMVKIYNGGIRDVVGGGFSRYSVDNRWHVPHFEKMLYDEAQLLSSALELAQLLPTNSADRKTLEAMANNIINYIYRDLRSPGGGFYSAEDADSLPSNDSTVKKEGAFYVWTAAQLDELLVDDSELFKFHYGVKENGNCDPRHDVQGELKGQNVLYVAHTLEETANKFGIPNEQVQATLDKCLARLKEHRDKHRPRPHLDDKILTCWNGLMISGLAKASEVLEGRANATLVLAEQSAAFIKKNLYDEKTGELRRSYREGPGPTGQADDYAFLVQGLLDLYEASGKEEYVTWAIRLQEKQDELFYDQEGGGYFASAPDPHILVRMKDAQDGAEPSAVSITLYNLNRLAHFAEDRHVEYQAKAQSILRSNSQLLEHAPFALATMVSAALIAERGYRQFIVSGDAGSPDTAAFLQAIRQAFVPNRVLVHLDPARPPRELAKLNGTLRALIDDPNNARPNVRVCENFTCGLPIYDPKDLKLA